MMFKSMSWKIGRVAGIDLYLHSTLPLMLLLLGLNGPGPLLLVAAFACVMLHELGHALMARQFGIDTLDITLYPIGGVARLQRMPRRSGPEMLIALAGPAVNVAIAVVLGLVLWLGPPVTGPPLQAFFGFLGSLLAINLGLALFNLVPAFPMDGGRVLRALLGNWMSRLRATQIAALIGQGLAIVFGFYCIFQGQYLQALLAAFVYYAAARELASVQAEEHWRDGPPEGPENPASEAPPGYVWVPRGNGQWRLAPIVLTVPDRGHHSYRSWR